MSPNRNAKRAALTLVEVLVVIGMLSTIVLVQAPAIQKARSAAAKKETENRLKQVALSIHFCHDTYKRFPPAWGPFPPLPGGRKIDSNTVVVGPLHYWLLPFFEGDNIYKLMNELTPKAVWAPTSDKVYSKVVTPYWAIMDLTNTDGTVKLTGESPWGVGNFAGNTRVFGGLKAKATADAWDGKGRMAGITDGTSNTIAFATRYASCGDGGSAWAGGNTTASLENFLKSGAFFGSDIEDAPTTAAGYTTSPPFQVAPDPKDGKNPCKNLFAHSFTEDGILVAMFDSSVRTVCPRISPKTWGQACHPSDGNILGPDWQ
jgi:hypothetical protein